MFSKKKKETNNLAPNILNYTTWEQDLGFLTLMITRATNHHKLYFIDTYMTQLEGNMMIRDEDIQESYVQLVEEVVESLSENYINFLITKYFKNKLALITFISDSVYLEILANANKANKNKIEGIRHKQVAKEVLSLNVKKKDI